MKIIHCLIHYFPFHTAGTEVYTQVLATLQKKDGLEVSVVTPFIDSLSPGNIKEHYLYEGIDVYQFKEPGNPSDPDLYTGKKTPEGIGNFITLLKKLQPDVVHFHEINISNSFCMGHVKAAKDFGAKVFYTMHLSALTCYTNVLVRNKKLCGGRLTTVTCTACSYNTLFKIPYAAAKPLSIMANTAAVLGISNLLKKGRLKTFLSVPLILKRKKNDIAGAVKYIDKLVCLTDWYRKMLLHNNVPAEKIAVIKQALPHSPGEISTFRKTGTDGSGPVQLIFIGRLQPQKGVLMLINAVSTFSPDQLTLDIYGKEERNSAYFDQCIIAVNNASHINWNGALNREDVLNVLGRFDMLCLPSAFSEMSPLVIQEAFAAGVPVLASRVYGNAEQVEHAVNGLLFDFNSPQSLTEQLQTIIGNRHLLYQLRQNIAAPGSFSRVHKQYLELYNS
ncbi:MAG TPA: glycosyltransferase [Ferruginibacter sp.]|nr:glycosyltransferase [Ferruginibacter sp.]